MSAEGQESSPPLPQGRRLALVVGVNGQPVPGRDSLQYAVDDGQDIAQVLQQPSCAFTLFRPLRLGEQATSTRIKDDVRDLANALQEDDFALFFFSGHAEALPIEANMDEVYLITDDFDTARAQRDKERDVSLSWLRQMLFEHEKIQNILIILDCCYAGKFADSAPDPYLDALQQRLRYYFGEPSAQKSPSRAGGIRLALTAIGDSTAKEQDGHGLLTGHILAALKGECEQAIDERGQVTFTSLFGALTKAIPEQPPRFFGAGNDLLLATHPHLSIQARRERERAKQQTQRTQRLHMKYSKRSPEKAGERSSFLMDWLTAPPRSCSVASHVHTVSMLASGAVHANLFVW
ncbi:MAG: caspase family protein [Ktedonobacteraceae bacterium]